MTPLQKKTAQALVNILETGSARGNYGDVTVIPGDAGHLTYGRSQTTLASGGLYKLIRQYCAEAGARDSADLQPYLPGLQARDLALDTDERLKALLRHAGSDPVMQAAQDAYFDEGYWAPAMRASTALGLTSPLAVAVVYDSLVHGSWGLLRDKTIARHRTPADIGEQAWIAGYIETRRGWFEGMANKVLRLSVRRMDAFKALVDAGNWDLALPFTFRGVLVSEAVLAGAAPPATLRLGARGDDVRRLQQALVTMGATITVDGHFGPKTEAAVVDFQRARGLEADGIVGSATWAALDGEILI